MTVPGPLSILKRWWWWGGGRGEPWGPSRFPAAFALQPLRRQNTVPPKRRASLSMPRCRCCHRFTTRPIAFEPSTGIAYALLDKRVQSNDEWLYQIGEQQYQQSKYDQGFTAANQGRYQHALEMCQQALADHPDNRSLLYLQQQLQKTMDIGTSSPRAP